MRIPITVRYGEPRTIQIWEGFKSRPIIVKDVLSGDILYLTVEETVIQEMLHCGSGADDRVVRFDEAKQLNDGRWELYPENSIEPVVAIWSDKVQGWVKESA